MSVPDPVPKPGNSTPFVSPGANVQLVKLSRKTLVLIVLIAFTLRLGWTLHNSRAMENEGAEYARIAQNLLQNRSYIGILGGPESIFPPLYPFLIAATSFVCRDTEIAGRAISLALGSLLVLPVFFISMRLFGLRTGYLAATLVALHPLLIALSSSVYVESTYLTLLFSGLYFGIRVLEFDGLRYPFLCGLFLGLAYLARPEGLAYALLVGIFILLALALRAQSIATALKYSATVAITTVILVIPYAAYLSVHGGSFRLEGKSALNEIINQRMNRGMSYQEAGYGLGPNLEPEGPYLTADQFALKAPPISAQLVMVVRSYFRGIMSRTSYIVIAVGAERVFGSPLICVLAVIGIFRPGWAERKWIEEGFLLSAVGLTLAILLSLRFVWGRYLFPFLPFLILWAAVAIVFLSDRIAGWLPGTSPAKTATVTQVLLAAILLLWPLPAVPKDPDLAEGTKAYVKHAGLWLNQYKPGNKDLMAIGSTLPYYANGTQLYLPYADSARALAYIHRKHPDFIILQADELATRPYLREWFQHSIPDRCAQLIRRSEDPPSEQIEIYQWTCSD